MESFNSYTVYDEDGNLIADGKSPGCGKTSPDAYFYSLSLAIQERADVMLVLQEGGFVARYEVKQLTRPIPTLGPREDFRAGA